MNGAPLPAQTSTDHIFKFPAVALNLGANVVAAQATGGAAMTAIDTVTWTRR